MKGIDYLAIASFFLTFLIAYVQWNTNEKRRRQDLFEKRCQFYEEIKDIYYNLDNPNKSAPYIQIEDISRLLPKALWLFGEDMREVLNNLVAKELDETDKRLECLPDEIEGVFSKYLRLEYQPNVWQFFGAVILFFIPNSIKQSITERWFYYQQRLHTLIDTTKRVFKRR